MTKFCPRCKENLPVEEFNWKIKNKKRASYCRECSRYYINEHYRNNKDYYKNKAKITNEKNRKINNDYVRGYLETHPCVDCGEKNPIVLDFDHLDPELKITEVSKLRYNSYSLENIENEIKKCEVRCSNCHRIKTHERRKSKQL